MTRTTKHARVLAIVVLLLGAPSCSNGDERPVVGERTEAELHFDEVGCRDTGFVDALDQHWELVDPVPLNWRGTSPRTGIVEVVSSEEAIFRDIDDTELRVTIGGHLDSCLGWDT